MSSEKDFLSYEDFNKFYNAIPNIKKILSRRPPYYSKPFVRTLTPQEFQLMFKLMYNCGLRISEVRNLTPRDFDLDKKELSIRTKKGVQYTTILPSDIEELRYFLKNKGKDERIFGITKETAWIYGKAIGETAGLNLFKKTKVKKMKGIVMHSFIESRRRFMEKKIAPKELTDMKLRAPTENSYGGKKLDDLKKWEEKLAYLPAYGVVIFGDILGTKGTWKNKEVSEVISNWRMLVQWVENFLNKEFSSKYSVKTFSDTIVILGKDNNIEQLLIETGKFLTEFLNRCILHDFPIRGCFSVGEFVDSENMIVGPAVDEAANFFEQSNWIGFSSTPSSYSVLERLSHSHEYVNELKKYFKKYDVPLKNGLDKDIWSILLDPYYKLPKNNEQPSELQNLTLEEVLHYKMEHPTDPDGNIKWRNSFQYIQKTK